MPSMFYSFIETFLSSIFLTSSSSLEGYPVTSSALRFYSNLDIGLLADFASFFGSGDFFIYMYCSLAFECFFTLVFGFGDTCSSDREFF